MKKAPRSKRDPDMLAEYDFSKGVRGRYAKRYAEGRNLRGCGVSRLRIRQRGLRVLVRIARNSAKGAKT